MNRPVGTTRISFIQRLSDRSDEVSWSEFHQHYGELLFRYARRCGASPEEAENVVQEVEMYLFKAMDNFQYDPAKGRFRAYLRLSVVRAMGRKFAKKSRQEAGIDPRLLDELGDSGQDDRWEREWRLHCLRWAFRAVAGEFAPVTLEAFRLHVLSDQQAKETAEHLGISLASVYQAKSRVLKRMKEKIDGLDPDQDPWTHPDQAASGE